LKGGVVSAPTTLDLGGGIFRNAGSLHVGGIGTIGTSTLKGDLVHASTGSVHIDIDPALGRADLLRISGRGALDGAIVVNPVSVHKGTSGPVITAARGLTNTALLQGLSGPVFTHTALVTGNTLSIATNADFRGNDPGFSGNQSSVAGQLQRIWDVGAPGFEQGFLGLSRLSDVRAYTQALGGLSGEVHASGMMAGYDQARQVQTSILSRLRQPSLVGTAVPNFAQATDGAAYTADPPGTASAPVAAAPAPALTGALWGEGFGSWGRTRSDGTATALETSTGGFVIGVDTMLGDAFRIGLAGGFARTTFDAKGRLSSGSNESVFGAVYGSGSWGALSVRLGAAYAWHDIDTSRAMLLPGVSDAASASYDGSTLQAFGEIGYRLGWGRASLEPFVGASILRLHTDAFREQGGVFALSGTGRDRDLATSTLGVRGEVQLLADLPLLFKGMIGWRHAYGDVRPDQLMAFAGGVSAFSVAGVTVDRNALVAEAGLDWRASDNLSLGVAYRGQIGTRAQDHALTGNLTWRFATR
jgi:fibronectin-binding autotransporter adhesin